MEINMELLYFLFLFVFAITVNGDPTLLKPRMFGGIDANPGEYPWHAAIFLTNHYNVTEYWAGGTLVSSRHILTSAKRFGPNYQFTPDQFTIVLGAHNVSDPTEPSRQVFKACRVEVNPKFDNDPYSNRQATINIATIITLKTKVKITDRVKPLRLAQATDDPASTCSTSGWGWDGPRCPDCNATRRQILRKMALIMITNEECLEHSPFKKVHENYICGLSPANGVCGGDEGALVCYDETGPYMSGISYGTYGGKEYGSCDLNHTANVFDRVSLQLDFITCRNKS